MGRCEARLGVVAVVGAGLLLVGCERPGGPFAVNNQFPGGGGGSGPPVTGVSKDLSCAPAQSSQPMPARVTAMGADNSIANTYFTKDLFIQFKSVCGGCHVDGSLGGFNVSEGTFPAQVTAAVLHDHIESDSDTPPNEYMPPKQYGGVPFSHRDQTDPIVQ